jgi:hypothetical protein
MIQSGYLYWCIVILIIFLFYSKNSSYEILKDIKEHYENEYGDNSDDNYNYNYDYNNCNSCTRKQLRHIRHMGCNSCNRENFSGENIQKKKKTVKFNPTPTTYYF